MQSDTEENEEEAANISKIIEEKEEFECAKEKGMRANSFLKLTVTRALREQLNVFISFSFKLKRSTFLFNQVIFLRFCFILAVFSLVVLA